MKNTNFRDQCSLRKLENCHCQFLKEDFSQYVYMIYLVVASTTAVCPVSEVRSWYFFFLFLFFYWRALHPRGHDSSAKSDRGSISILIFFGQFYLFSPHLYRIDKHTFVLVAINGKISDLCKWSISCCCGSNEVQANSVPQSCLYIVQQASCEDCLLELLDSKRSHIL